MYCNDNNIINRGGVRVLLEKRKAGGWVYSARRDRDRDTGGIKGRGLLFGDDIIIIVSINNEGATSAAETATTPDRELRKGAV